MRERKTQTMIQTFVPTLSEEEILTTFGNNFDVSASLFNREKKERGKVSKEELFREYKLDTWDDMK